MSSSAQLIHKVGAIILDETGRMLAVHKRGKPAGELIVPGGKIEHHENHETALRRELREELGVELLTMTPFNVFEAVPIYESGLLIMYVYHVAISGEPVPSHEIDQLVWLDENYLTSGYTFASILGQKILPSVFQLNRNGKETDVSFTQG